jgi:regulatory protein
MLYAAVTVQPSTDVPQDTAVQLLQRRAYSTVGFQYSVKFFSISVAIMTGKAYEYALNLLSARAYSTRNLRRKLVQKEFEVSDVDAVMHRLTESGLLDDARFAREYARQKLVVGGSSSRRVQQDLAKRGIPLELARESVAAVVDEECVDTFALCERAAVKKIKSMAGLDDDTKRRRLFGFLARRGHGLDDIKKAIATIV